MIIPITNAEPLEISTLILDLNGTLTVDGILIDGVRERLVSLKEKGLRIVLLSGDTRGNGKLLADDLNIDFVFAGTGEEKRLSAIALGPSTCATIGNGLIDVALFKEVKLAIAVMQGEGVHVRCLNAADIVVPSIIDALDLLIKEQRLIATLRP